MIPPGVKLSLRQSYIAAKAARRAVGPDSAGLLPGRLAHGGAAQAGENERQPDHEGAGGEDEPQPRPVEAGVGRVLDVDGAQAAALDVEAARARGGEGPDAVDELRLVRVRAD